MQNDGDKINWNDINVDKYRIYFDHNRKEYYIGENQYVEEFSIYFKTRETAERAIKEIIKPFLEEHPKFIY
jgi:hypothetical protein